MRENSQNKEIQGWIEVLHCKHKRRDFPRIKPLILEASLASLKEEHYVAVGSPLPACEYDSVFEVYEQFLNPVESGFGIARSFRAYDAINLCVARSKDPSVKTLILLPRRSYLEVGYREERIQFNPSLDLCLAMRKAPFRSFMATGKY